VTTATESTLHMTRPATNDVPEMLLDDPVSNLESFAVSSGAVLSSFSVADLLDKFSVDTERPITTFLHPLSDRNKFIVGHEDCPFFLWNVASGMWYSEFLQSPRAEVFAVTLCDSRSPCTT
jgi:hypothetical protein